MFIFDNAAKYYLLEGGVLNWFDELSRRGLEPKSCTVMWTVCRFEVALTNCFGMLRGEKIFKVHAVNQIK